MMLRRIGAVAAVLLAMPDVALAHSGERAFVLLLPTGWYTAGGALVVALSFVAVAAAPRSVERLFAARRALGWSPPRAAGDVVSLVSLAFALVLVAAGFLGSRDPLANPLPLTIWSLWWVGLTMAQMLFGDLWSWLDPWRGIHRLLTGFGPLRAWRDRPPLRLPDAVAAWPAWVLLVMFAWIELVYPAPRDPARLATFAGIYLGGTLVAMLVFGAREWRERGEVFSVFFSLVARLAALGRARQGRGLDLAVPGARLVDAGRLDASRAAFVVTALATVSFDGYSRTFAWLGLVGANPLEYPGRSALLAVNSAGLVAMPALLAVLFLAAVAAGRRLAGARGAGAGRHVVAIVPIAFGYHFAHYMPGFAVDAQYAIQALSDPFGSGLDLLGVGAWHVHAALLNDMRMTHLVWALQVAAIVVAHVAAVAVSHVVALGSGLTPREAARAELPMVVLMVGYTWFGLWLLASPAAA